MKKIVSIPIAILVLVTILTIGIFAEKLGSQKINCSVFGTNWEQAQETYLSDKEKYKRLDWNKNDLACEDLMK